MTDTGFDQIDLMNAARLIKDHCEAMTTIGDCKGCIFYHPPANYRDDDCKLTRDLPGDWEAPTV